MKNVLAITESSLSKPTALQNDKVSGAAAHLQAANYFEWFAGV